MKGCAMIGAMSLLNAPAGYMSRVLSSIFKSVNRHAPVLPSGVVKLGPVKGFF
jgi:hypothetical protein